MSEARWTVKHPPHGLSELWRGEICISDRVFSTTLADQVARRLNAYDDLLAACEAALASSESMWGPYLSKTSKTGALQVQLRAAIAKAKGDA